MGKRERSSEAKAEAFSGRTRKNRSRSKGKVGEDQSSEKQISFAIIT